MEPDFQYRKLFVISIAQQKEICSIDSVARHRVARKALPKIPSAQARHRWPGLGSCEGDVPG